MSVNGRRESDYQSHAQAERGRRQFPPPWAGLGGKIGGTFVIVNVADA